MGRKVLQVHTGFYDSASNPAMSSEKNFFNGGWKMA
jgi:hypothetical protein